MLRRIATFSTLALLCSSLQREEETKGLRGVRSQLEHETKGLHGVRSHASLVSELSGAAVRTHLDKVAANGTEAPYYREWHKRWTHKPVDPKHLKRPEYRQGYNDHKADLPRDPLAPNAIDRNAESTVVWLFALVAFGLVVSCMAVYQRIDGYAEWAQVLALGLVAAVPAGLFTVYTAVVALAHFGNGVRPTVAFPDARWQCGSMTWYLLSFPISSLLCLVFVPLWFVPSALTDPEGGKVRNLGLIGKLVPADWFMAFLLPIEFFLFCYGVYLVFGTGPNQTFCEPEVWWSAALLAGFSSVLMVSVFLAGCVWYSFQSLSHIPWARDMLHSITGGSEERIKPERPLVPSLGRRTIAVPYSKRAMMMSETLPQEQRPVLPATPGPSEFQAPQMFQPRAIPMSATLPREQRPAVPATLGASDFPVQPIFQAIPTPPSAARVEVPQLALPKRESTAGFAAPFAAGAPLASPPLSPAPAQRWPSTGFLAPFANKQMAKAEAFVVGDRVQALYLNGRWYGATVAEVRADGTHLITWDDGASGDREKPREKLRFEKAWASVQSTDVGTSRRSELHSAMEGTVNVAERSARPKVGDFVRVARPRSDKDSHMRYDGMVGKIITDDGSPQPYQIEGMEGVTEKGTVWFFEDELEVVQAADSFAGAMYPTSARPPTAPQPSPASPSPASLDPAPALSAATLNAAAQWREESSQGSARPLGTQPVPGLSAATLNAAAQWKEESSQGSQASARVLASRRSSAAPSLPVVLEAGNQRQFRAGERVRAKYRSQVTGALTEIFFEGEVLTVNPTGTLDIKYSDGAKCQNIPPEAVQPRNEDI